MQIQITRSFIDPISPRPFLVNELLNVPDALGTLWIDEGRAQALQISTISTPLKQKRERATRGE